MLKMYLLGALLLVALFSVFFYSQGKPKLDVTPEKALADVPVKIALSHLKPHEQVTIKASRRFKDDAIWSSSALFEADDKGNIDVSKTAPVSGSYQGIEPMGLFWSMGPAESTVAAPLNKDEVLLSVYSHNKLILQKTLSRLFASSEVEHKDINEEGIVGVLYYPKQLKQGPAIITVTGSSGGISTMTSQLLASHGYAVLALGYFGMPGLPATLENVPLEYFQKALHWLKKQPQVNPDSIALWGYHMVEN